MEANKILNADILDIVFEGKNKEYGAYDLRKTYQKRLTMALIITAAIGLAISITTVLASVLTKHKKAEIIVRDLSLTQAKKEDKKEPPPPPKPKLPPPPKIQTIKFTPPKVVHDAEVKPEEKPPENKDIQDQKIDVKTQEGIKDNGIVQPAVKDAGTNVVEQPKDDNTVFTKVEIEASFPGGDAGWKRYLERNLNPSTPSDNNAPAGSYTVIVKFIVSRDGSLSDVQCVQDPGYGTCEEAIRVIKRGPKWAPGRQNGHDVISWRQQPITFVVLDQ